MLGVNNATGGEYNCTSGGAWNLIGGGGGSGTVTSVSFTGGLISVANPTTTPAFTVAGTSGGIPFFDSATTWNTSAALASGGVVLGGGAATTPATNTRLTFATGTLTVGLAGTTGGVLNLAGATSGGATLTAPAIAGTSTNGVTASNVWLGPDGAAGTPTYSFASQVGNGMWTAAGDVFFSRNTTALFGIKSTGVQLGSTLVYGWANTGCCAGFDTSLARGAAGLVNVSTGGSTAIGFIKSAQTIAVTTADVTCGTGGTISSCVAMQTITGLTATLPLVAANWSFTCDLIVSQATAAAADQIGVQTATNGATNIAASATAPAAAGTQTIGAITGVASTTTAQSVITFTPTGVGTKLPIHLSGTIEGASTSGTVFNVTVLTGAAADLLTIYRGSACYVY